jgi:hypothetical protein
MHDDTYRRSGIEELARRESDGLEVSLLWNRDNNGLTVLVCDTRTNDVLELKAGPHEAMEVFHHPYAHLAFRGLNQRGFQRLAA